MLKVRSLNLTNLIFEAAKHLGFPQCVEELPLPVP